MHKKRFILSVIVMIMLLIPAAMNAQGLFGSDGFFKVNEDNYNNRDIYTIDSNENPEITGITNQTFGQPLPLGSGIAVLVAAGAGYAIMKRKKQH